MNKTQRYSHRASYPPPTPPTPKKKAGTLVRRLASCEEEISAFLNVPDSLKMPEMEVQPKSKSMQKMKVALLDAVVSALSLAAGCSVLAWFVPKHCMRLFPHLPQQGTKGFYRALQGIRNLMTTVTFAVIWFNTETVRSACGTNKSAKVLLLKESQEETRKAKEQMEAVERLYERYGLEGRAKVLAKNELSAAARDTTDQFFLSVKKTNL